MGLECEGERESGLGDHTKVSDWVGLLLYQDPGKKGQRCPLEEEGVRCSVWPCWSGHFVLACYLTLAFLAMGGSIGAPPLSSHSTWSNKNNLVFILYPFLPLHGELLKGRTLFSPFLTESRLYIMAYQAVGGSCGFLASEPSVSHTLWQC